MTWRTLRWDFIDEFKKSWPCHGLPDNLHSISCCEVVGELYPTGVEIEAFDESGKLMDTDTFDGPALVALVDDCLRLGDDSD